MTKYQYFDILGINYFLFPLYGIHEKSIQTQP